MKEDKKIYWNSLSKTQRFFTWFSFVLLILNCSIYLQLLILVIIMFYEVEVIINMKGEKDKS